MPRWTRFRKMFGLEPTPDVEAELAFHVEMRVRELIEQGETPERARARALQRFGDFDRARQACVNQSTTETGTWIARNSSASCGRTSATRSG